MDAEIVIKLNRIYYDTPQPAAKIKGILNIYEIQENPWDGFVKNTNIIELIVEKGQLK